MNKFFYIALVAIITVTYAGTLQNKIRNKRQFGFTCSDGSAIMSYCYSNFFFNTYSCGGGYRCDLTRGFPGYCCGTTTSVVTGVCPTGTRDTGSCTSLSTATTCPTGSVCQNNRCCTSVSTTCPSGTFNGYCSSAFLLCPTGYTCIGSVCCPRQQCGTNTIDLGPCTAGTTCPQNAGACTNNRCCLTITGK